MFCISLSQQDIRIKVRQTESMWWIRYFMTILKSTVNPWLFRSDIMMVNKGPIQWFCQLMKYCVFYDILWDLIGHQHEVANLRFAAFIAQYLSLHYVYLNSTQSTEVSCYMTKILLIYGSGAWSILATLGSHHLTLVTQVQHKESHKRFSIIKGFAI